MGVVLWLMAAILVIVGIVQLFQGQIILWDHVDRRRMPRRSRRLQHVPATRLSCPTSLAAPRRSSATTIKAGVHRRSSSRRASPAG